MTVFHLGTPQCSQKALYESEDVQAYWDIPVFVEYNKGRAKRMHARIVDHQAKTVTTLEMSCPWIQNREKKDEEVLKYGPLRWERKLQFKEYRITQYSIIIYVLGGWSSSMEGSLSQFLGNRCKEALKRMQRPIISSSLNFTRTFKVVGT